MSPGESDENDVRVSTIRRAVVIMTIMRHQRERKRRKSTFAQITGRNTKEEKFKSVVGDGLDTKRYRSTAKFVW